MLGWGRGRGQARRGRGAMVPMGWLGPRFDPGLFAFAYIYVYIYPHIYIYIYIICIYIYIYFLCVLPLAYCSKFAYCLLPNACCSFPMVSCASALAFCLMSAAYCMQPIIYSPPLAHCLLPITYRLLRIPAGIRITNISVITVTLRSALVLKWTVRKANPLLAHNRYSASNTVNFFCAYLLPNIFATNS